MMNPSGQNSRASSTGGPSRRSLIRAGLASTPVLMGLTSQPVLATGSDHVNCSVWASLTAANGCRNSHLIKHVGKTCKSPTDCVGLTNSNCDKPYHLSTGWFSDTCFKSSCTMRDICRGTTSSGGTIKRTGYSGNYEADKLLLSKYCAALYVTASIDAACPISKAKIQEIWNTCKDSATAGCAPPINGTTQKWTRKGWCDYFAYICNGTAPSSWGSTCNV